MSTSTSMSTDESAVSSSDSAATNPDGPESTISTHCGHVLEPRTYSRSHVLSPKRALPGWKITEESDGVECEIQPFRAIGDAGCPADVFGGAFGESQVGDPLEQLVEGYGDLDSGQVHSEAAVDA